jgi:hypothetical protein
VLGGDVGGPGAPNVANVPGLGHPASLQGLPAQVSCGVKVREKFGESFALHVTADAHLVLWMVSSVASPAKPRRLRGDEPAYPARHASAEQLRAGGATCP